MNKSEAIHILPGHGIEEFPTDVDYLLDEVPTLISTTILEENLPMEERIAMEEYSDSELIKDLLKMFIDAEKNLQSTGLPRAVALSYALGKKAALIKRYTELGDARAIIACETAFTLFKLRGK